MHPFSRFSNGVNLMLYDCIIYSEEAFFLAGEDGGGGCCRFLAPAARFRDAVAPAEDGRLCGALFGRFPTVDDAL